MGGSYEVDGDVLIGGDGHLFLHGGAHASLARALRGETVPAAAIETFRGNILGRKRAAAELSVAYAHVIFPDKHSVLPELAGLPRDYLPIGTHLLRNCPEDTTRHVSFPIDALRSLSQGAFFPTDSHLSADGVCAAVVDMLALVDRSVDEEARDVLKNARSNEYRRTGDLGRKLVPERADVVTGFRPSWKVEKHTNGLVARNDGIIDLHVSSSPRAQGSALLMGDSFLRACAPVLSYFFREVLFLRTRFMHREMLEWYRPDVLITANVERYLRSCVPDSTAPLFLLYPYLFGAACEPSPGFGAALASTLRNGRAPDPAE